jgi:hypothetical protein
MYTWLLGSYSAILTLFTRFSRILDIMKPSLAGVVLRRKITLDGHDMEPGRSLPLRMGTALARWFYAQSPGGYGTLLPHRSRCITARYVPQQRSAILLHNSETTLGLDTPARVLR